MDINSLLESLVAWGPASEVTTKFGPRLLRKGMPTEEFWKEWRTRKEVLKQAGISLDKDNRGEWLVCWWAPIPEDVARARAASIEASRALDSDADIPVPEGLSYYPFQRAGIVYARERKRVLIADEPGLGKTIQALGVINCLPTLQHVLTICPATVKLNWQREAKRWLVGNWEICVLGMSDVPSEPANVFVIVNYDQLGKHEDYIKSRTWDLLIVDEAHYIRNQHTQRSRRVKAINAHRRIYLTGTPIVNSVGDLWPLIGGCDERISDEQKFLRRYVRVVASKREQRFAELQRILRESCMVRRRKADVLTELPAKTRQIIAIEPHTPAQKEAVAREVEYIKRVETDLIALRSRVELAKAESEEAYRAAVMRLRAYTSASFEQISALRRETALSKVPDVISHLENMLAQVDKVVLWAHHYDVINAFLDIANQRGWNPVCLTGQTVLADRQMAVDKFQNDKTCRLFIGNLRAGGIGITLTAASHVVVAELPWTAEAMTQAEDRCHRIGQHDNVLVQHIVLEGSIDVNMARAIVEKQYIADKTLDDFVKSDPILPTTIQPSATESVTISQITENAMAITPEQVDAIHAALRSLASADDDYASIKNDYGFNKFDSAIGHALANSARLTQRQAALGQVLIRKYWRQFDAEVLRRCGINNTKNLPLPNQQAQSPTVQQAQYQ